MNLVGKIFIVLIFIMSLVFMSFSVAVYATHKNWRLVVERPTAGVGLPLGLKFQIVEANKRNEALKAEHEQLLKTLADEQTAKREALAKLKTEQDMWQQQLATLTEENKTLQERLKTELASLATAHENLKRLTDEVGGLRDEIRMAQDERDRHFKNVIVLTDQVQQTKGELARLQERSVQLVDQVARMKNVLRAYDLTEYTPIDKRPPQVRGKILAVNQNDLVEVSLGSDDGMRTGHTLEAYRSTNYLGKIEVLSTEHKKSVGKILASYKRGIIQKGDDVATRFKAD